MKTKINEIKIVATSKFRLNNAEMSNLIGGTSSLDDDSSPVDSIYLFICRVADVVFVRQNNLLEALVIILLLHQEEGKNLY